MEEKRVLLLEYDAVQDAVFIPDLEHLQVKFPPVAVWAFFGEGIDEYAREKHFEILAQFISITKKYPVYLAKHKGKEICLCQAPVGAAAV